MTESKARRVWKNEYLQTAIMILVILAVVWGFWYGSRWALNTDYPMLAVASGSMSLPKGVPDDGWSRPFDPTLHTGDLILIQGVNASDIYAAPLNQSGGRSGDILVFHAPGGDELIVHRAIQKVVLGGEIYFVTQGDANQGPGPYSPTPASSIIGRVVLRVPWIGHLALYMRNSAGIVIIVALIIVLVVIEFVIPAVTHKKPEDNVDEHVEQNPETENPI